MELVTVSIHMWLTFAVIICAILLYASERLPMEIISLGVLVSLLLLFYLIPAKGPEGRPLVSSSQILAGFAHPALITILALMVIGRGMSQTAALEGPTTLLLRYGRHHPKILIFTCLLFVLVISAFLNDTPVVVMFLPIMIVLADKLGEEPGQVLMPLSFAAILGGMTTLIGTSTNLLVAGSYHSLTGESIGFFEFTVPGITLALTGLIFIWFATPRLLRATGKSRETRQGHHGRQFIVQIEIKEQSPHLGACILAGMLPCFSHMTVRLIKRGDQILLPPFEDICLESGDIVIGAATREKLHDMAAEDPDLFLHNHGPAPVRDMTAGEKEDATHLYEVLVPPASLLEGHTLAEIGPCLEGGSYVVALQRKTRMGRTGLHEIRLEAGDILLVCGTALQMRKLRSCRDVVLMEWSGHAVLDKRKKGKATLIFLATIFCAASGLLPIVIATVSGAFLMVISGCLTIQQAGRALDRRVLMLVATALAMGTALSATGGAAFFAHGIVELLRGATASVMLSALFLLVAVVSNLLSNNTTAILFTPIAVDMAVELGLPATPFVVTVIFAANCSFATPVSYQTNLLVMGPGNYRFSDYMKLGIPLALLLWLTFSLIVPRYYGL